MSAMSFCASFETSWASAKPLSPWTTVASTTAPTTSGSTARPVLRPITSSIRNFVEPGQHEAGQPA